MSYRKKENSSYKVLQSYEYNARGQITGITDRNGGAIRYRYNSFGKVRERIDQTGDTETFRYDEEGNLSLHIDRDGRRISRTYNVFGNLVCEKATDENGENPVVTTCRYDSLGRLIHAVCNVHSYEYIYNDQGRLKEKRSGGRRLISYTYDRAGKITEITDPAGVTTHYEYDILGRTSRISSPGGMEVRYRYDCLDRLEQIRYGNGIRTSYRYDADGSISHLETSMGNDILLSFRYQYDGNGNRLTKTGTQGPITDGSSALDITYQYDVRGQLLEENRKDAVFRYSYDAVGNRIRKEEETGKDQRVRTEYAYNEKNQLIHTEEFLPDGGRRRNIFTYSKQGSILREETESGISRYFYNSKNQQIRVECADGQIQENRYDAEGLRHEMRENGKQLRFVYQNGELLYEEGGDKETASCHLGAGIEAVRRGQRTYYYHPDEQLSTALITDETGTIKNQYRYDAFGAGLEVSEELPNRIRYTGQQYDEVTEQYYLRARYYNPILGRFLQEDVYQGDGLNLYAYCRNNPVVYWDPSGYSLDEYLFFVEKYGADSIEYWSQGYYSPYRGSRRSRFSQTPGGQYTKSGSSRGYWENTRGESMYTAYDYSPEAIRANAVLRQYGQKGILYNNATPDFRPVSEEYVIIENMTENRRGSGGNFQQADEALAKLLNANPDHALYGKIKTDGPITRGDVADYRESNQLTWHEENDRLHMDLVSEDINRVYGHLGGVSESKQKEEGQEYQKDGNCKGI